jgi:AcrR family transcriptional regulator
MTRAKPDRRMERTRSTRTSAFVELLLTRGYEGLSVEDIVGRANIGRSTFYLHFRGKEDILKSTMSRPSTVLAIIVGHDVPPAAVIPQIEHFYTQRRLNRVFFDQPVRALWVACLAGLIEPRLTLLLRGSHTLRPMLPLSMIAAQIAEAQIALVSNWLMGRNAAKPEVVAEALIAVTHANVCALLRGEAGKVLVIPGERLKIAAHAPG